MNLLIGGGVIAMPIPPPIWFVAAFISMVASQVLRLRQHDQADGFFGITLAVWVDWWFWRLSLGLSHSAMRNCECLDAKSPVSPRYRPRQSLPRRMD
jgi:hypothetical protein